MAEGSTKKLQILVDEPEIQFNDPDDTQKNEFVHISENIAEIIMNSKAQFTIGITGKWGTGKTTMMKTIQDQFKNPDDPNPKEKSPNDRGFLKKLCDLKTDTVSLIGTPKKLVQDEQENDSKEEILHHDSREIFPTTWFNAWRFEREDTKATIPLMITIIERLLLWINQYEYKFTVNNKNPIYEKLRKETVSFLNSCDHHFQITIPGVFTYDLNRSSKDEKEDGIKLKPNDSVEGIPKPVLQKGLDIIDQMISYIRKKEEEEKRDFRLIVFVDDLDRCTDSNALEVLDSIKVLLGMEGIVYVVGISDSTIFRLIDKRYEGTGIEGKDYIKKIIQIKFPLRVWTPNDIVDLIKKNILNELGKNAPSFLIPPETKTKNYEMISKVIEANPRELKRFLNNLILSFAIIKNEKGVDEEDLLIVEAFRSRWEDYFVQFTSENSSFKNSIKEFVGISDLDEIRKKIGEKKTKNAGKTPSRDYTAMEKMPDDLWKFLNGVNEKLYLIKPDQWKLYLRATESLARMGATTEDLPRDVDSKMLLLLQSGRIEEFNKTRPPSLNLRGVDLTDVNLNNVNLAESYLNNANLNNTFLNNVNFSNASLTGVSFKGANLSGVSFNGARLDRANLSNASLNKADLNGANFIDANLTESNINDTEFLGANLKNIRLNRANLNNVNLTDANLTGARLNRANLNNADLTNVNFIDANLVRANLAGSNLAGAHLDRADLSGTNLNNAKLYHANFTNVQFNENVLPEFGNNNFKPMYDEDEDEDILKVLKTMTLVLRDRFLEENSKYKPIWYNRNTENS